MMEGYELQLRLGSNPAEVNDFQSLTKLHLGYKILPMHAHCRPRYTLVEPILLLFCELLQKFQPKIKLTVISLETRSYT